MSFLSDVLAATFRNATPLVYGTVGETYRERRDPQPRHRGDVYAGAFFGFLVAQQTGSLLLGLAAAIGCGLGAGLLMGVLTVTFGANQHVSGLGLTLFLIGAAEFVNRLQYKGSQEQAKIEPCGTIDVFGIEILSQYALTYVAFLVVVPLAWWVLMRTTLGLNIRAVGENPEAADAAGVNVARTRYLALLIGGALMGVGGAFFTLAALGSFTLNIIAGRGWVYIALVIFGRWRIGRGCSAHCCLPSSTRCSCGCGSCPSSAMCRSSCCWRCPTWS